MSYTSIYIYISLSGTLYAVSIQTVQTDRHHLSIPSDHWNQQAPATSNLYPLHPSSAAKIPARSCHRLIVQPQTRDLHANRMIFFLTRRIPSARTARVRCSPVLSVMDVQPRGKAGGEQVETSGLRRRRQSPTIFSLRHQTRTPRGSILQSLYPDCGGEVVLLLPTSTAPSTTTKRTSSQINGTNKPSEASARLSFGAAQKTRTSSLSSLRNLPECSWRSYRRAPALTTCVLTAISTGIMRGLG